MADTYRELQVRATVVDDRQVLRLVDAETGDPVQGVVDLHVAIHGMERRQATAHIQIDRIDVVFES